MKGKRYVLTYKKEKYELDPDYWEEDMPINTKEFQLNQLKYCIEVGDFITLENRINGMLKWGGIKKVEK